MEILRMQFEFELFRPFKFAVRVVSTRQNGRCVHHVKLNGVLGVFGAILLMAVPASASPFRSAADANKPEIAIGSGRTQEEAEKAAKVRAVDQRCGAKLIKRTMESNDHLKSTEIDAEGVQRAESSEIGENSRTESVTGGSIARWSVVESNSDGKTYTVTLSVFIEKCLVDGSGRISIKSQGSATSGAQKRPRVDENAVVEKSVTVSVYYPDSTDSVANGTNLDSFVMAAAKSFAINVAKVMVLGRPYATVMNEPVRSEITVHGSSKLGGGSVEQGFKLDSTVTLYGVNEELNNSAEGGFVAVEPVLRLSRGYSSLAGFAFLGNNHDGNLVVLDVDKRGPALGKLIRGDIIESFNLMNLSPGQDPVVFLESSIKNGPVKVSLRRGNVKVISIIR